MRKDKVISVRLSEEEESGLKEEAEKIGVGTSTLIRMIIKDYLKEKKKEREE